MQREIGRAISCTVRAVTLCYKHSVWNTTARPVRIIQWHTNVVFTQGAGGEYTRRLS